ncbi:50S ribosomal protein L25/general stress protein Ctc [Leucobacter komagatae]|uniref:Large ribosomal subunit protein bL25 n=1 Tax=Leucobacter komagatae TaxID=55969 RepID=A0A0D0HWR6_9MICO|nr:50S ribosomal protein L25/general stress protein Ctc [Leucobacter komagatae]KIP52021.1 50S ribosomal protein L25 [Leucobacter komagatae]
MSKIDNQLDATVRESFGKGAARKLRAAGKTPAVVYGHGTEPKHVTVETHPLSLIVRYANPLVEVTLDGKKDLVLIKDVQKDPVRQIIEHVDMLIVKKGEKVEVEVPIHIIGESFSGTTPIQELNTIRLLVPATSIPESVEVNIEGAEEGTQVLADQLDLPKGAELVDEESHLVVQVIVPRGSAADDEADAAAEAAAE